MIIRYIDTRILMHIRVYIDTGLKVCCLFFWQGLSRITSLQLFLVLEYKKGDRRWRFQCPCSSKDSGPSLQPLPHWVPLSSPAAQRSGRASRDLPTLAPPFKPHSCYLSSSTAIQAPEGGICYIHMLCPQGLGHDPDPQNCHVQ